MTVCVGGRSVRDPRVILHTRYRWKVTPAYQSSDSRFDGVLTPGNHVDVETNSPSVDSAIPDIRRNLHHQLIHRAIRGRGLRLGRKTADGIRCADREFGADHPPLAPRALRLHLGDTARLGLTPESLEGVEVPEGIDVLVLIRVDESAVVSGSRHLRVYRVGLRSTGVTGIVIAPDPVGIRMNYFRRIAPEVQVHASCAEPSDVDLQRVSHMEDNSADSGMVRQSDDLVIDREVSNVSHRRRQRISPMVHPRRLVLIQRRDLLFKEAVRLFFEVDEANSCRNSHSGDHPTGGVRDGERLEVTNEAGHVTCEVQRLVDESETRSNSETSRVCDEEVVHLSHRRGR